MKNAILSAVYLRFAKNRNQRRILYNLGFWLGNLALFISAMLTLKIKDYTHDLCEYFKSRMTKLMSESFLSSFFHFALPKDLGTVAYYCSSVIQVLFRITNTFLSVSNATVSCIAPTIDLGVSGHLNWVTARAHLKCYTITSDLYRCDIADQSSAYLSITEPVMFHTL